MFKHMFWYLVILLNVFSAGWIRELSAADLEPTNAELLEQVGKAIDVGTDSLAPLMNEQPKLFENMKDTVTAVKVVDLLFSAKDTEALAEVCSWQFNKRLDGLLEKLLPSPALVALNAAKIYKNSLELIRDVIVVPAFDNHLYEAYKKQRSGAGGANMEDAFTEATVLPASGYYLVKPGMLEKYYKAKGWNKDAVGEKLESAAVKQIDAFWMKRLEARYQQEQLQAQAKEIRSKLWADRAAELAAIRAALAAQGEVGPFFANADLAKFTGWHFSLYTRYPKSNPDPFVPRRQDGQGNNPVSQTFYLQKDGFSEKLSKDAPYYPYECDSAGKRLEAGSARVYLIIHVWPRILTGTYNGKPYGFDQIETIKTMPDAVKANMKLLKEIKLDGVELGHLYLKLNEKVETCYWFDGVTKAHRIQLGTVYTLPTSGYKLDLDTTLIEKMIMFVAEKDKLASGNAAGPNATH